MAKYELNYEVLDEEEKKVSSSENLSHFSL